MVVEQGPGDFYRLKSIPSNALSWLRYNVPADYRYYEDACWFVHSKHLLEVIELAYKQTGRVDDSSLSDYIREDIAQAKQGWKVNPSKSAIGKSPSDLANAYSILHLLPSASYGLVAAVWRYLARKTHPDRGGDSELFRKYAEAYQQIKKDKEGT